MEKKDKIRRIIEEDRLEELNRYKNDTLAYMFLKILNEDLSSFSYLKDDDVYYLERIIELLPKYVLKDPKKFQTEKFLNIIHQQIKTLLVQKPGYIDKSNYNYKLFKIMINNIEMIQMAIRYNYTKEYQGSKYKLINYLIFELKNISIVKDAINKFPFLVNYFDKDDTNLIVSVMNEYLDSVINYKEENTIDDIIYYDQVINEIMNSKEFVFDVIDKQTILKKARDLKKNLNGDIERKIFYLNSLIERINGKEEPVDDDYNAYKFNISREFNPAIKSEIRNIKDNYSMSKDRRIIDDYILSFDGEDTKEIDDALSIDIKENGNLLLGVHIADPLDLIDIDSIIFEETSKRTTSIYLSDKTIPMFPEEIGSDLASLKEKNYRPAISYYFEFDKNGLIVNYDIIESIIKVNRNLTYSDFNHILTMNSNDRLNKTVNGLSMVSNILQRYYSVDPLYSEVNRESSNITNTNITGNTSGEKTIESSMVFTGHIVAKTFKENNWIFNYRNHVINNQEQIDNLNLIKQALLEEKNDKNIINYIEILKNIYPRAYNDIECLGHAGLGLTAYGHVTSPIRRIEDINNIICIYKHIFHKFSNKSNDDIKRLVLRNSNNSNKLRPSIENYSSRYEKIKKTS